MSWEFSNACELHKSKVKLKNEFSMGAQNKEQLILKEVSGGTAEAIASK